MALITTYRHGVPNWADVAVTDTAAGAAFYSALFGWDVEDQGADSNHYHMFSIDGRAVAGLGPKQADEDAPLWTAYMSVDDLDAVVGSVSDAGGTVLMPRIDIGAAGSMAVVLDSTGAPVCFWEAGEHIGAESVNVPNTVAWHELTTRDPEASKAFYGTVLGWQFQGMGDDAPAEMAGYEMIMVGDRVVGGIMPMVGDEWGDLRSHWMIYLAVDDTDATAARVAELGGQVSVPPFDIPIGRCAVVNDPDGNAFSVISFAGPVDEIPDGIA